MVDERVQRKLAAILAADVAGYSRLMGVDEEATLAAFKQIRDLVDPLIERHAGRVFGGAGDSLIAEFTSPVEAVRCAIEIQTAIENHGADIPENERMRFRIGINLGDVMIDGENLMGDGVNVAARLEALASPGGVCVSDTVVAQVRDRLDLEFVDLGEHHVKNIVRPLRAYRVPLASEIRAASPYRGLDAFEFEHAHLFYGRTSATTQTKERLERQAELGNAFLLVYGMSGTGKSSLMKAGLLPALVKSDQDAEIGLRRYCLLRPSDGSSPTETLINRLQHQSVFPELSNDAGAKESTDKAAETPQDVVRLTRRALAAACAPRNVNPKMARLIVAVDQIEELFTSEQIDAEARIAFVEVLAALARSGQVWVVCTIRADFYHRCGEVPGFSELKDGLCSYELLPPTGPEIAQMIREPARVAGMKFEVDAELGDLADVLQQAATKDSGTLPLLQFMLDALFEFDSNRRQMTFAAYRALGGLEGAIARRADDITSELPKKVQDELPILISGLTIVRQLDDMVTARPAPKSEICSTPERTALVNGLLEARLLVGSEGPNGEPMIRLAHEALLSFWPRAQSIVDENREYISVRSRVVAEADRWMAEEMSPDLLLPIGKRLVEAEDMLHSHIGELDPAIREYVEASILARDSREQAELEMERQQQAELAEHNRREAESARKLAGRTRIAAAIMLVLAIVAGVGAFVGLSGQRDAQQKSIVAEKNAKKAREAEHEAQRLAAVAIAARDQAVLSEHSALRARNQALRNESLFLASQARAEALAGNTKTAIRLALEALPSNPEDPRSRPYVAEAEAELYTALLSRHQVATMVHEAAVAHAVFSPKGDEILTASFDNTARIWSTSDGAQQTVFRGHTDDLEEANYSADGRKVVTASRDGTARVWNVSTAQQVTKFPAGKHVRHASFSPVGNRIVTNANIGATTIWNVESGQATIVGGSKLDSVAGAIFSPDGDSVAASILPGSVGTFDPISGNPIAKYSAGGGLVNAIAFSPDGSRLIYAMNDLTSILWDVSEHRIIAELRGHSSSIRGAVFSPNNRLAATITIEGSARLWDASTGTLLSILGKESDLAGLEDVLPFVHTDMNGAFSPDSQLFASAALDGVVRVWNVSGANDLKILGRHAGPVEHVAFSPDGLQIVTASHDGTARLWDINGVAIKHLRGHKRRPVFVAFSPDGNKIATASSDNSARIWHTQSGREFAILEGHQDSVLHLSFSPNGQLLVTASADGTARVWDTETGALQTVLSGHEKGVQFARFSPDGSFIVTASSDGTARVWRPSDGVELAMLDEHTRSVKRALFSPDGRQILTASSDGTARLWEFGSSESIDVFSGHDRGIRDAAFSPNGEFVVTASDDQTARIWRIGGDRNASTELAGHNARISAVVIDTHGKKIATASSDHTARIWDAATGADLAILNHSGPVRHVAFSPDGKRVLTTSDDGTARLWDVETGAEFVSLPSHTDQVRHASFSDDGRFVATVSNDKIARIFPFYPSLQSLITNALEIAPSELSPCQRKGFFLPVESKIVDCP
ncbi:MAG: adenylate/guanylate cyclase domain-containing protein [Rhizobiaceae bacterium]